MKVTFTQEWKDWIQTNIANGQNKNGLFKILLDEGYDFEAIAHEMNYRPTVLTEQLVNPFVAARNAEESTINGAKLDPKQLFLPNAQPLDSQYLSLHTVADFLNADECDQIIELIKSKRHPSGLSSKVSDSSYRTSSTCDLGILGDPFMEAIDQRICRFIGIDASYSEVIQGQYYEIGQEFKEHTDYFESSEIASHGAVLGQRTYTFMIYLNDVEEGGETAFTKVGKTFTPKKGMAVIWNSLNDDGSPNPYSAHHAYPVIKGYKAIITKWFRSKSALTPAPPMRTKEINEYIPYYTNKGIHKTTLPSQLYDKLLSFYQNNTDKHQAEHVLGGFIVKEGSNESGSLLLELSTDLRNEVHDVLKPLLEAWSGEKLESTYVYGIRTYLHGAVLNSHRDRIETHIISAILNIHQTVNEDWPLVIDDHYYRQHHVMLKPGEVVFYEGARLKHGRPIPLNGDGFANIFCHFKPSNYQPPLLDM